VFGFFALKGTSRSDDDAPIVVRITGRASFGYAECYIGKAKAALPPGTASR